MLISTQDHNHSPASYAATCQYLLAALHRPSITAQCNVSVLQILWMRSRDIVILSHGDTVFTSDARFSVGSWLLALSSDLYGKQIPRVVVSTVRISPLFPLPGQQQIVCPHCVGSCHQAASLSVAGNGRAKLERAREPFYAVIKIENM